MYKRGDVFWADLSPVIGSEQDGVRPVVILQNDIGNKYSPTVIVAPLTSNLHRDKHFPIRDLTVPAWHRETGSRYKITVLYSWKALTAAIRYWENTWTGKYFWI